MEKEKQNKLVFDYVSTHEAIIANKIRERDGDIKVTFTTFGNRAACQAITEIIEMLINDYSTHDIINMMKNKKLLK